MACGVRAERVSPLSYLLLWQYMMHFGQERRYSRASTFLQFIGLDLLYIDSTWQLTIESLVTELLFMHSRAMRFQDWLCC